MPTAAPRHDPVRSPAEVLSGADRSISARVLRLAAACAEPFYAAALRARNLSYERHWLRQHELALPVVSVGNLTVGGTGKTPMVIHLIQRLKRIGRRPAVLLRGYRARPGIGSDEARLIESTHPDIPVLADPDRHAAAERARRDHPETDLFLLDDGFQHRRIQRDLDLVLIDATNPFGYGHVLPRGLMREPPCALRRADAVLVTHADRLDGSQRAALTRRIHRYHGKPPLAWCAHHWSEIVDHRGPPPPTDPASPTGVVAFCGIGNPDAFFDQARERMNLLTTVRFADHHGYTHADLDRLYALAHEHGADALLTTEKDWVKLKTLLASAPPAVPLWYPRLRMDCLDGSEAVDDLLGATLGTTSGRTRPS